MVREICRKTGRTVGIMGDLQGPKIRVGKFRDGKVTLKPGDAFILDADCELGDEKCVGLDYKELPRDVSAGDVLLLDDGRIEFDVERVEGNRVHCRVHHGGVLSNNKGINRRGGGLTAPALTTKDMDDIRTAAAIKVRLSRGVVSRNRAPICTWRAQLLRAAGGEACLIAKIERAEAMRRRAGGHHVGLRRHHGGARRPRGRSRRRRGAGAAKAHDPHGARARTSSPSPRRR